MDLDECLPPDLRGPATTIARIAAGLSGAGVYRVEAAGGAYVLKISAADEPLAAWRARAEILQAAAAAGLAPRVVHVDEARRAVTSAFVVDRSFFALFGNPQTRAAAIAQLGATLRRAHALPLPAGATARDPLELVGMLWGRALAGLPLPAFVGDAVRALLAEVPPPADRAPVLSHNDVNPTNLVYDGEHIVLLDWDAAGPNDPLYDVAAIALFTRMDDATCAQLVAAHDDAPAAPLTARFAYLRRLVAVMCGVVFLHLARSTGHAGTAAGGLEGATLDATADLAAVFARMQRGELTVANADGKYALGLALVKASY